MSTINIDELANEITESMCKYTESVTENIKKAIDIVADEVNEEIKNNIRFKERSGKYVKAFRIKKSYEDKYNKRKTWCVVNGQHRLTHLLEKGHALAKGGRARAYPHIEKGEKLAIKRMEELAAEAIANA